MMSLVKSNLFSVKIELKYFLNLFFFSVALFYILSQSA